MLNISGFFSDLKKDNKLRNHIISNFNIYLIAFIGTICHPLYWFWWTYIDPKPWEMPYLRIIGFLSCFLLLLFPVWPKKFKKYKQQYWLFVLTYNLPFFCSFYLIASGANIIWISALFPILFLSIMFIVRIWVWIVHMIIGVGAAVALAMLLNIDLSPFNYPLMMAILPIFIFGVFTAFIFSYSNANGIANEIERREKIDLAKERQKVLQGLGGSIAHEMRNPLGSIHHAAYIILEKIKQIPKGKKEVVISRQDLNEISDMLNIIDYSSTRGNMLIDVILSNIYDKETDKARFKIYKISQIVETVMKEFAFSSSEEKARIAVNIKNDFYFKGDENMMVFVLFNLLKNALYYLQLRPESSITISTNNSKLGDNKLNYLYFKDTGVGIAAHKLEIIFEPFMTSEKVGGTGLGLPFCRRVMNSFDGNIICNSQLGKFTEFVMSFPKISAEEKDRKLSIQRDKISDTAAIIKKIYNNKTVLLVDDQMINRKLTSRRLEKLGFKVMIACHGQEALDILSEKGDKTDLIFMDLHMPEMDGYEVAHLIKLGHKNRKGEKFTNFKNHQKIEIMAFSGNNDQETMVKVKEHDIQLFLGKGWSDDELIVLIKKLVAKKA